MTWDNAALGTDYGENAFGAPVLDPDARRRHALAHGETWQPIGDGYRRCACPHHPALRLVGRAAGCGTHIFPSEGDAPTRCDQCRARCGEEAT